MSYSRFIEQERMERNAVNAKRPPTGTPHKDPEDWLRYRNCSSCGVEWTAHRSTLVQVGWVGPCCLRNAA
jgi:hypothetical protein